MTPENKEKLATNIANAPKMLSAWFITIVGLVWTAYISLPAVCEVAAASCLSQAMILDAIRPLFAWVPPPILALATTVLGLYLRMKPQANITPAMALAKSAAPDTISEPEQLR